MNLLYEYYTKTSHCVCLYIVLFCFCWVGFSCGFVRWNGLFLMKYLENENKSNQMNGTRNVLFCFVYSFVFLFSHKKSMIFKYFIGIVAMSQWVYKKKQRIFWHRGQHIKLMLSIFTMLMLYYWTYLSWFTYFQVNLSIFNEMKFQQTLNFVLFFFVYLRAFV